LVLHFILIVIIFLIGMNGNQCKQQRLNVMRKSKNVRRISFRGTPKILTRASQLESARSQPRYELDGGQLARPRSGSEDGQMRRRSGDLRGVQGSGGVVDLWGYRSSRPRIEDRNRSADIGHDGPIEKGVIDVRSVRDNYVVVWEFPTVFDVDEMRRITREMFVDQDGSGPKARTVKYSAITHCCIVRSFWVNKQIETIFGMAAQTQVPKRLMKLQRYDLWREFNDVMIGAVDYLTDNPADDQPIPLDKYLRLFQAGHLDRDEAAYELF